MTELDLAVAEELSSAFEPCLKRLFVACLMILEIGAPGAATVNKRLYHGPLGLDGVVQVVGGPFMQ